MRNIALILTYEGTGYHGWQMQKNLATVQQTLEKAVSMIVGHDVHVTGCGRTDAGVHARGQVANFHTESEMKCWEMKYYLNRYLPQDIAVLYVADVPERFHSRLNAKSKRYIYRVAISDVPCVFDRKYTWYCFDRLDVGLMKKAAALMVGERTLCTVTSVSITVLICLHPPVHPLWRSVTAR